MTNKLKKTATRERQQVRLAAAHKYCIRRVILRQTLKPYKTVLAICKNEKITIYPIRLRQNSIYIQVISYALPSVCFQTPMDNS